MSTAYCYKKYHDDEEFRQRRMAASKAYLERERQDPERLEELRARRAEYMRAYRAGQGAKVN